MINIKQNKMKKIGIIAGLIIIPFLGSEKLVANDKITICHNNHEITIDMHALPAHLDHGDDLHGCNGSGNDNQTPDKDLVIRTSHLINL